MRRVLLLVTRLLIVIMVLVSIQSITYAETTTSFSLTQSNNSTAVGEKQEMTFYGNNLNDLYAYEAVISFDQNVLELEGVTSKLEGFSVPPMGENNKMYVAFTKIGKKPGENGSKPLFTITYKIKGKGDAKVKLESVKALNSKLVPVTYQYDQAAVKTFSDLGGYAWAKVQIESLLARGVIAGTSETTFSPQKNITRADFICILIKAFNFTATIDSNFSDVKATDYYYKYVGIAKKIGLTAGTGNNLFRPKDNISRQDIMVMVVKAMKLKGIKIDQSITDLSKFSDSAEVAPYAVNAAAILTKEGIISGSGGRIRPKAKATRAEAAVIIYGIQNK